MLVSAVGDGFGGRVPVGIAVAEGVLDGCGVIDGATLGMDVFVALSVVESLGWQAMPKNTVNNPPMRHNCFGESQDLSIL
jgi:hypothetical protein